MRNSLNLLGKLTSQTKSSEGEQPNWVDECFRKRRFRNDAQQPKRGSMTFFSGEDMQWVRKLLETHFSDDEEVREAFMHFRNGCGENIFNIAPMPCWEDKGVPSCMGVIRSVTVQPTDDPSLYEALKGLKPSNYTRFNSKKKAVLIFKEGTYTIAQGEGKWSIDWTTDKAFNACCERLPRSTSDGKQANQYTLYLYPKDTADLLKKAILETFHDSAASQGVRATTEVGGRKPDSEALSGDFSTKTDESERLATTNIVESTAGMDVFSEKASDVGSESRFSPETSVVARTPWAASVLGKNHSDQTKTEESDLERALQESLQDALVLVPPENEYIRPDSPDRTGGTKGKDVGAGWKSMG